MQNARLEMVLAASQGKALEHAGVWEQRAICKLCLPAVSQLHFQTRLAVDENADLLANQAGLAAKDIERRASHALGHRGQGPALVCLRCWVRDNHDVCHGQLRGRHQVHAGKRLTAQEWGY